VCLPTWQDIDRLFNIIGQYMRDAKRGVVLSFVGFARVAAEALGSLGTSSGRVRAVRQPPVVKLLEHVRDWTGLINDLVDNNFARFGLPEASGGAVHLFWLREGGLVYKLVCTEPTWRPMPCSRGSQTSFAATAGRPAASGVAVRVAAAGPLEWEVTLSSGARETTLRIPTKPILLFLGDLPELRDLKECAVQDRFLAQGGTYDKTKAFHRKFEQASAADQIWLWGEDEASTWWIEWLKKWAPGETGCVLHSGRQSSADTHQLGPRAAPYPPPALAGPDHTHPELVPHLTAEELCAFPKAARRVGDDADGGEGATRNDDMIVSPDVIDHSGRTAQARQAEARFIQEEQDATEVPAVAEGMVVIVMAAECDTGSTGAAETAAVGMLGVPVCLAKVLRVDSAVDTTKPDAAIPVQWLKPAKKAPRDTIYDRKWVPWRLRRTGPRGGAQGWLDWEGDIKRSEILVLPAEGAELLTNAGALTAAAKKALAAVHQVDVKFKQFSKYRAKR
jgi:hypothetical protein